ncbi:MAG: SH3 domain-containing protein, partial [Cyanobacteria bacterium P01_H01_bin.130]
IWEKNTANFLRKLTQDADPPTNVRSGPGKHHSVVGTLDNGTSIEVINVQEGWLHLANPVRGWIAETLAVSAGRGISGSMALSSMANREKYDHYRQLVEASGGVFREGPKDRNLVGFRIETSTKINRGKGAYDDRLVMVWKDGSGQCQIREYPYCTEPGSQYEHRSPLRTRNEQGVDANRDGRRDLGRIPAGYYEYVFYSTRLHPRSLIPTAEIMAERDTDHDGKFEAHEPKAGDARTMLFHPGNRNNPVSAGCQTLHPDIFEGFWADLRRHGKPNVIGYTLVNWAV